MGDLNISRSILLSVILLVLFSSVDCNEQLSVSSIIKTLDVDNETSILTVKSCGFNSLLSEKILNSLVPGIQYNDYESQLGIRFIKQQNSQLVGLFLNDSDEKLADIALIYIHPSSLLEESTTLLMFHNVLKSIVDAGTKKTVILVINSTDKQSATLERKMLLLLSEAWTLFPKGEIKNEDFNLYVDLQMVTVPLEGESSAATATVSDILNTLSPNAQKATDFIQEILKSMKSTKELTTKSILDTQSSGISIALQGLEKAVEFTRDTANRSLQRLQKAENADEFVFFVNAIINQAEKVLIEHCTKFGIVSSASLNFAKNELRVQIFKMMSPFHRRHVQLVRQACTKKYNAEVEEIEVTVKIIDDLKKLRDDVLSFYRKSVKNLAPIGAPNSWDTKWDELQLQQSLDEYIDARTEQCRAQGILPRGRRPIAVSMHMLAMHPFGRDHRQEPLSLMEGDALLFDETVAKYQDDLLIHPRRARPLLVAQALSVENGQKAKAKVKKTDMEFAREMLMFPLSLKDPAVPLMGGRARRSRGIQQAMELERENALHGPERFIRWDLEPMNEVKNNLEALHKDSEASISVYDKVMNVIPAFRKGFYVHPPINHQRAPGGEKYLPSRPVAVAATAAVTAR
eukprot:gene12865-27132_t